MNKETITRDNEKVALLLEKMNRLMENMESLAENYKPVLGGERFLTDKELSGMLKVSRLHCRIIAMKGESHIYNLEEKSFIGNRT